MFLHFIKNNLPAGLSVGTYTAINNEMTPQSRAAVFYWEKKKDKEQILLKSELPINPAARNKSLGDAKDMALTVVEVEQGNANKKEEELEFSGIYGYTAKNPTVKDEIKSEDQTKITTPPNSPFEIRLTPCKGYSIFAKSAIPKGTLILSEKPLLRIIKAHYLAEDVEKVVARLSEQDKNKYWNLASAHGQDPSKYPTRIHPEVHVYEKQRIREQHEARTGTEPCALSIFMTNAMECGSGAAVFEIAARFNHSCIPNAFFSWHKGYAEERVYASRDIEAGEEITLSYCDPFYEYSQRRWELQHYGFVCVCPACTDLDDPDSFGFKSRERRWRLSELDDVTAYPGQFSDVLRAKIEMARLMKEEGLSGTCLGDNYLSLARLVANAKPPNYDFVFTAATKALDVFTTCLGADSEKSVEAEKSARAFDKQAKRTKK